MPLISSPGVAFIVVDDPPGTSANAVFNSVLSGWPVLVLTLLMALLSGIIMWGLVSDMSLSSEWLGGENGHICFSGPLGVSSPSLIKPYEYII